MRRNFRGLIKMADKLPPDEIFYAYSDPYSKQRAWMTPEEIAEDIFDFNHYYEPYFRTKKQLIKSLRSGDTFGLISRLDKKTVPYSRFKMMFGLMPDSIELDESRAVIDDSGTQKARKSETSFLRGMWRTGDEADRDEIRKLLKTYLFKHDLDDLTKKADADRNRMVADNRQKTGLPVQHTQMRDSTGKVFKPGMKMIGSGNNRAFVTPEQLSQIGADRSKLIHEHPGQFAAAVASPWLAAAAATAGTYSLPHLPQAALWTTRLGKELGTTVGKTVWTGGGNLIADEVPLVRAIGHAYRAASTFGPPAMWAKKKYDLTAEKARKAWDRLKARIPSKQDITQAFVTAPNK